jgi:nitrogen fixation protein NifZ
MLSTQALQPGDLVYSRCDLFNDDGAIPDVAAGALLVPTGARGVIVKSGYAEVNPEFKIYLVRFEGEDKELGLPIGCLADELTQEEQSANDAGSNGEAGEPVSP